MKTFTKLASAATLVLGMVAGANAKVVIDSFDYAVTLAPIGVTSVTETIKVVIATSIMFVLIIKNIYSCDTLKQVQNACNVTEKEITDLAKKIVYYKTALIKKYI